jgi:transposase
MAQAVELPQTLEAAHALILEQASFIHELKSENENLKHRLDLHARRMFGKRSEQLDAAQLELAFEALEAEEGEPETDAADEIVIASHKRRRKGHGRTKFSDDIPRERVEIEPEDTTCPGCEKPMARIGEETSEQLDYVPATLRVILTVRPKYACPTCKEGVFVAPAPRTPIRKGKATASTLAHVAVSKYVDHLPLNRQSFMFARQGVLVSKQTLGGWIRQVSALLEPIERAMWRSILSSAVLLADETPVKVLVPGRKETKRAYLWAYLGDHDEVAFDFSMGRGSGAPVRALDGYVRGVLMADAYAGYNRLVRERPQLLRAACWAHARRYFFEAKDQDPERVLPVLALIRELYAVEKDVKSATTSPAERAALGYVLRQEKSRDLVALIEERLQRDRDRVLPKSPTGKAIRYALGQWTELTRFLKDGVIPIDNNAVERELRTVAVGRNNWTFCGGEAGGHWAARLYGLLGTCKLQGVEPFAWLSDVLDRVRDHPADRMDELTPRIWAATPTS